MLELQSIPTRRYLTPIWPQTLKPQPFFSAEPESVEYGTRNITKSVHHHLGKSARRDINCAKLHKPRKRARVKGGVWRGGGGGGVRGVERKKDAIFTLIVDKQESSVQEKKARKKKKRRRHHEGVGPPGVDAAVGLAALGFCRRPESFDCQQRDRRQDRYKKVGDDRDSAGEDRRGLGRLRPRQQGRSSVRPPPDGQRQVSKR